MRRWLRCGLLGHSYCWMGLGTFRQMGVLAWEEQGQVCIHCRKIKLSLADIQLPKGEEWADGR